MKINNNRQAAQATQSQAPAAQTQTTQSSSKSALGEVAQALTDSFGAHDTAGQKELKGPPPPRMSSSSSVMDGLKQYLDQKGALNPTGGSSRDVGGLEQSRAEADRAALEQPMPAPGELQNMSKAQLQDLQRLLEHRSDARSRAREAAGGMPTGLATPEEAADVELAGRTAQQLSQIQQDEAVLERPLPSAGELKNMSREQLEGLQQLLDQRSDARTRTGMRATGGMPTGLASPEDLAEMELATKAAQELSERPIKESGGL